MTPEFSNPAALALLLLIPAGLFVGWRRGLFWKGPRSGRHSWRRGLLAAAIRMVFVLVLILGLSGLRVRTTTHDLALIFLVDVSASMPRSEAHSIAEFINFEFQRADPRDYIGIIAFGSEPSVELAPTRKEELGPWQLSDVKSRPGGDHTDIAAAL